MSTMKPQKVQPGFFERNERLAVQMMQRGWLGWALLATIFLGSVHILRTLAPAGPATNIGSLVMCMVAVGSMLRYSEYLTTERAQGFWRTSEWASRSLLQGALGLKAQVPLVLASVAAIYCVRATTSMVRLELPAEMAGVLEQTLDACVIAAGVCVSFVSSVFHLLRARQGLSLPDAVLLDAQDLKRNARVRTELMLIGVLAAIPVGVLLLKWGVAGLLHTTLFVPLAWLYFREAFLGETGLPDACRRSAPELGRLAPQG